MSSKSLNKVILIGNITRDPELRYTPQGNAVCTMGLATNRSWKTENGEIREEAEFHRLVAWNKLGELCSQLCSKGRKIYVEGRLQTRTFTGSDNAQHTITEIVIDDMILLDSKIPGVATNTASSGNFVPSGNFGGMAPRPQMQQQGQQNAPVAQPISQAKDENVEEVNSKEESEEKATPSAKGKKKNVEEKAEKVPEASFDKSQDKPMKPFDATQGKEDVNIDDIPF